MYVKKIMIAAALLLMSTMASAQARAVFKAGINIADYWGDNTEQLSSRIGPRIGLGVEIPFSKGSSWSVVPSLYFTSKGGKEDARRIKTKTKVCANYLSVPVNVQFRHKLDNNCAFSVAFGPYFAYGVGGKSTISGWIFDNISDLRTDTSTFGKEGADFNRFDTGLNCEIGLEYQDFILSMNCDLGLTACHDELNGQKYPKNRSLGLTLGHRF